MVALPPQIAVHCRGVVKSDGTGTAAVNALRGVDLDIGLGEVLMLVGPSGCGKTTLILRHRLHPRPSDGDCRVFGQDFQNMPPATGTRHAGRQMVRVQGIPTC